MWLYPLPLLFNKSSLVPIPINCEIPHNADRRPDAIVDIATYRLQL
jgi:hypothetical protein